MFMNSIIADLNAAMSKKQLVNIYLNTGDIFYTGYIETYNDDEVIIATYESSGLADGYVAMKTAIIESVERQSEDLDSIKEKMLIAKDEGLMESKPSELHFDTNNNLFPQILIQAYLNQEVILIHDNEAERFYTGMVKKINNDSFKFFRINKFDFMQNELVTMGFNQSMIIEFQGRELSVMSKVMDKVKENNIAKTAESINNIIDLLNDSFHHHNLVEVRCRYNDHFFYVGEVIMLNDSGAILKVVDMSGQFGGYVFIRMNGIQRVTVGNDYLELVQLMKDQNIADNNASQPVLNDSREFDSTEDNLNAILTQSMNKHQLIRLQLKSGSNFLGYPEKIGPESMKFSLLDETVNFFIYGQKIPLNDIVEVGFEYIYAYLDEQRLRRKGDM